MKLRAVSLLRIGLVIGTWQLLPVAMNAAQESVPSPAGSAAAGNVGFGAETRAGRGGRVIKVTNLNATGAGSFAAALQTKGPRIVVFEVGGVIDLGGKVLKISEPFLTVAGQTAPTPGVSVIRGGVGISTHDVLLQHIRVRAGDLGQAQKSGWEVDSMATTAAWNVVVDHCSLAWSTDENLSASGPRFSGHGIDEWRRNTSHDVTFRHCIIAEGLSRSTHIKGEHSKGSLIHDNATRIAIIGNLYASNVERNPLFKRGVQGVIVNNLIDNPGSRAVHYGLVPSEWEGHPYEIGKMVLVGNVLQYGPDTKEKRALLSLSGDGSLEVFAQDNLALDRAGQPVEFSEITSRTKLATLTKLDTLPFWPEGFRARPAAEVKAEVLRQAGARPWDRDEVDQRVVRQVVEGKGRIIDSQEQVGGYPKPALTRRALAVPRENVDAWLASFTPASFR
jgi:hypothetical protein